MSFIYEAPCTCCPFRGTCCHSVSKSLPSSEDDYFCTESVATLYMWNFEHNFTTDQWHRVGHNAWVCILKIPIFAVFAFQTLNLSNPHTFRDLSKPMGAQTTERKQKFIQRYNEVEKSEGEGFRNLTGSRGFKSPRAFGDTVESLGKDTQSLSTAVAKGSTCQGDPLAFGYKVVEDWKRNDSLACISFLCAFYCCVLSSSLGQEEMQQQKAMFLRKGCSCR